ncbi:hypothetical protein ACROYT_G026149 [Oculina patagonica]
MNLIIYFLMSITPYLVTGNKDHVTLLFVGDISFSGPVKYYVEHKYHTYNDSFNEVAPYIREADISVGNLECPFVSKDVYPYKFKGEKRLIILDSSPKAASALSFAGFDAVTVANNHFNDFGSKGANFTVEILKKEGIKYFGISYGKYNSSQEPLVMERNGIKIGFLGYCDHVPDYPNCTAMRKLYNSGPAIYRDDIATRDVNKLKQAKVDIIVVFMHWGRELLLGQLPYQLHITEHLMSLGVQVIIGSHPHVLQSHWMTKDNKLVAYSLGNFLFPPMRPLGGNDPNVYGRMGKKPNLPLIQAYEYFTFENFKKLKSNRMLKVIVTRNGVVKAEYLPTKLAFDQKTKRLHSEPVRNAKWITVCGDGDEQCRDYNKN